MNNEKTPPVIPAIHQNLPLNAINQVVFNGDKGFEDCQTVLLLQPDKTRTYEFLFDPNETPAEIKNDLEFWVKMRLPILPPPFYVLLAIHSNGLPLDLHARKIGSRAFHFIFVEEGAFEFREKSPEDFRPRKLEIKILENGLRFYSDASYLIWNEENAIPAEVEAEFGKEQKEL